MRKNMKIGIRAKIMSGYLLVLIMVIFAFFLVNNQFSSVQADKDYIIIHDFEVTNLSHQVEKYVLDMVRGQRGYIITGEESYLQPYNKGNTEWRNKFDKLYSLVNDPVQQAKLLVIKDNINKWIDTVGEPMINQKKQESNGNTSNYLAGDQGGATVDLVRSQFDNFREVEHELRQKRSDALNQNIDSLIQGLITLGIIVFIVALAMSTMVSRSIVKTINEVIESIKDIATFTNTNGLDLSRRIKLRTQDEIRELGNATNELLTNLEQREMHQRRISNTFNSYQGITSIADLCKVLISTISEEANTSYGAIYVRDFRSNRQRFVKSATFADGFDTVGRNHFELGQGLIGEYALKKRMHILHDLDEFQLIPSALGTIRPKGMIIAPVLYDGEVIAVIEILSLTNFSKSDQQFIVDVIENFGITLNSAKDREEIERLLTESQAMTEELRVQSDDLQTQSEELQMQSEELQTINEKLEERSKEAEQKSVALNQAKVELEQQAEQLILSSKYKSEFLANVSHELRTPLNSILILSELIAENAQEQSREEEEKFAKVIHTSGKDLLSLIDDILDLSKVEAGKMEIEYSEMNIDDLPNYLEMNFNHVAEQKGLLFNIVKDPNIQNLFCTDEKRMLQILKNLLSNAFKYTEKGSVLIEIKKVQNKNLEPIFADKEEDYWISFSIKDTGIGIPPEKHQLIFKAFQQADGATMRKYGGTGLGLSICQEYAKLLGGYITLGSEEGVGSTFTLYLPSFSEKMNVENTVITSLEEVAASAIDDGGLPLEAAKMNLIQVEKQNVLQGKNVLIVDDDLRNIFALEAALKQEGMIVTSVNNGLECLDILEVQPLLFDIILMDIMMPNMDGYETMQKIRSNDELADLPIIALTAKAMERDRKKCLEKGASDYVSKPLDLEQLLSVLRVWVSN
ncbi:CHASE3 domain-containing protein [Psychrobacillus sp. OK032]|uniref:CHASE3 domain-containing protein n=1 Tax=Psychrobacillus sp. OK032 TaxID=1884358 RepID=UPI0008CF753A|nr:CHASE3 domain-containing protein [Psychrobacillus sp. OK032]SER99380.1 two-component system, chemotaxis family, sensor kinase CheA [Psychrobacillus sp. OK032]